MKLLDYLSIYHKTFQRFELNLLVWNLLETDIYSPGSIRVKNIIVDLFPSWLYMIYLPRHLHSLCDLNCYGN